MCYIRVVVVWILGTVLVQFSKVDSHVNSWKGNLLSLIKKKKKEVHSFWVTHSGKT